jgi:spore coat protein CotH
VAKPGPVRCVPLLAAALLASGVWTAVAKAQTQKDFFDDEQIQDVRLTLSLRDWETLKARPFEDTYYTADLRWRGITVRNVGIRSRGFGTRNGIKPGLRVDINRYLADQEFLGLKSFVLDNTYTDPSLLHESVAMKLFARMDVPAPREAHARLFVNDEYVGVYVVVESVDRAFVARAFGPAEGEVEDGGYLFEYRWTRPYAFQYLGPALESYAALFVAQTRETDSMVSLFGPLEEMIRTVNESPAHRFTSEVGRLVDLPAFIRYLAVQTFLAEIDGFVGNWGMNNFYLYRFRAARPMQLIPWDADHSFWSPDESLASRLDTNVLTRRLAEDPVLYSLFLDALTRCAALAAAPDDADSPGWLEHEITRQARLIEGAVAADPVFPFSVEQFTNDIERLRLFARRRPAFVRCAVDGEEDSVGITRSCAALAPGAPSLALPKGLGRR